MGAGNMMGGGGGSNPKLNAKNRGAFAVGGMGRPGNGGVAGTIPGLNINRDRWKGFNADQRQDWRAFQQAGGKAGTGGGFGAFQRTNAMTNAMQDMRNRGGAITQSIMDGPVASQPASDSATTYERIQAVNPGSISAAAQHALSGLGYQLGIAGPPSDPMSGTAPPQATTSPPASDYAGAMVPAQGTAPPAAPPPAASTPAQGAFARQRRDQTPGIGGQDANWWRQVGYTPHFVSQLPGLLQQAGDYNYGGMDPSTVNWSDPRAIRRAAAFLPYDVSQYRSNGRGRGGGSVWNGWKPGDFEGRGMPISAPPSMLPNSGGA